MLNHTKFGNGIASYWQGDDRRSTVLSAADGNPGRWTRDSRKVWAGAFAAWPQVRETILTKLLARNTVETRPPLAEALALLDSEAQAKAWNIETVVARAEVALGLGKWRKAVAAQVVVLDGAVAAIPDWVISGGEPQTAPLPPGERKALEASLKALARAAGRLRETLGGHGFWIPPYVE